jgi:hypothetical protein
MTQYDPKWTLKLWSLSKIGAKIIRPGCSIALQMVEVMAPRTLFQQILAAIAACDPKLIVAVGIARAARRQENHVQVSLESVRLSLRRRLPTGQTGGARDSGSFAVAIAGGSLIRLWLIGRITCPFRECRFRPCKHMITISRIA